MNINFAGIALSRLVRMRRLMSDPVVTVTPPVEQEPPFFTVWRPSGSAPTKRHDTRGNAEHEAERVARMHPGHDVFVMAPVSRVKAARVEREDFTRVHPVDCMCSRCDEVPF
ncbi:hypothetical protein [Sphingobium sp. Z007]|uniref:hypothetical protein n=1 Tax=Sphingobium sp. Z007 TaxID=627495 RepID=UPI000B4A34BD|nr:hypothetical protein [Sphingobium sp. Z007]